VAHVLDGRHFGGAEQMVRRLMKASPRVGVGASAYCLSDGRLAEFLRAEGLAMRVFRSGGRFDIRMLGAMSAAAREDSIQILQAHTSRTHLIARLLSRRLGAPNITTIQSPIAQDENRGTVRHPLRAWIERLGRPWTDQIVPVSEEETARLAREEGVAADRLTCIPNAIDPPEPPSADQRRAARAAQGLDPWRFSVAMIAQMRPRKGAETLLRAFARLSREGMSAQLLMIGDDEFTEGIGYLEQLQSLARELGIAAAVKFTGFLAEPWQAARGADLFVLPSLFGEGLPLVLLEAMSHGLALAVSDTPGNRELVEPGRTGWLHPAGNDAVLADQIAQAAADPEATARMGSAGRERLLARYTLERVMAQWRGLYERLLSKKDDDRSTGRR
jgi:glycosyltransferase involved in cell wall biosynthesis